MKPPEHSSREAFHIGRSPNKIGPSVYDIHSPTIPSVKSMVERMKKSNVTYSRGMALSESGLWIENSSLVRNARHAENMVHLAQELRVESN